MARTRPSSSSGLSPAIFGGGVILVAAVGVAFLVSRMQPPPEDKDDTPTEKVDPFAGLAPDVPPGGKQPSGKGAQKKKKAASDPFAGLASLKDEDVWVKASEAAERGMTLAQEASKAKLDGDRDVFKEKGKAAKKAFEEALDATADWEETMGKKHGYDSAEVNSVIKARNAWRQQLVALKKTVGF
ncbi:MAG: hypothetical protein AAF682_01185 [Planctomycetota bacterium]